LADLAIFPPVLGFLITNISALLITPLHKHDILPFNTYGSQWNANCV